MRVYRADRSGEFGHVGWGYRDPAEFMHRAADYLADGLKLDQRVAYVGADDPATTRAALAAAGLGSGSREVHVKTVPEHYLFRGGVGRRRPDGRTLRGGRSGRGRRRLQRTSDRRGCDTRGAHPRSA